MGQKDDFARKLSAIKAELHSEAKLLIVSKNRSAEEVRAYYELGHRDFGENKVQELEEKASQLRGACPEIRWHMIGHLQSNKINHLFRVPNLHAIHSVHDRHLLDKLLAAREKLSHPVKLFLQVNTSKEAEKSGFETYSDLEMAAESLKGGGKLELAGLMTMGTLRTEEFDAEAARCFQDLNVYKAKLQSELGLRLETSMGMSQDYKIALREKSNWIRLGTSMFQA